MLPIILVLDAADLFSTDVGILLGGKDGRVPDEFLLGLIECSTERIHGRVEIKVVRFIAGAQHSVELQKEGFQWAIEVVDVFEVSLEKPLREHRCQLDLAQMDDVLCLEEKLHDLH